MPARIAISALVILLVVVIGFVLIPSPIDPVPFIAAPSLPATGVLAANDALRDSTRTQIIGRNEIFYPEDVTFGADGALYVSNAGDPDQNDRANPDARIDRITFAADDTYSIERYAALPGGAPLDLRFDAAGNLLVAVWFRGLVSVAPDGNVTTLIADGEMIDGEPFGYADGIAVGADGTIYVTQGEDDRSNQRSAALSVLENAGAGRLIAFDPTTGAARTLIPDLSFGNGIVIAPDQSYLLVADQFRYQIKRYWLTGAQAGTEDIWLNNLPGFPHNLYLDEQNVLWVTLAQPRNPLADSARQSSFIAAQLGKILQLVPGFGDERSAARDENARGAGSVLALSLQGEALLSLQNPPMHMNTLSTAVQRDGAVYIGTIGGDGVLRYQLDAPLTP